MAAKIGLGEGTERYRGVGRGRSSGSFHRECGIAGKSGFDLLKEGKRREACVAGHATRAGGRGNWRCKQFESITEDRCSGGAVG